MVEINYCSYIYSDFDTYKTTSNKWLIIIKAS